MASTPRRSIDPVYLQDMSCPICGQDSLQLKPMERYPDYVTCGSCESQFVLEDDGERVMYGKIPASYPRTRQFALQQWVWPEAIARRASEERLAAEGAPSAPATQSPAPDQPSDAFTGEQPASETTDWMDQANPEPNETAAPPAPTPPVWESEPQDEEAAELKALLDEAAMESDEGAFTEEEPSAPGPEGMDLQVDAGAQSEADGNIAGFSSTAESESSVELDWEQAPSEWSEPEADDTFAVEDELPAASAPGGAAEAEAGETTPFDYGLEDDGAEPDQGPADVFAEQPDEQIEPAAEPTTDDWFFAESEESGSSDEFEADFAADVFGAAEPADEGAEPPDEFELDFAAGVFGETGPADDKGEGPEFDFGVSPPFADDATSEESDDLLPGETEPAPAMPDWLQTSTDDFDEPSTPPDEPGAEADDLLDTLWGSREAAGGPEDKGDDAAAAAGLGALFGAADDQQDQPSSESFDLWDEEPTEFAADVAPSADHQVVSSSPGDQPPVSPLETEQPPADDGESGSMTPEREPSQAEIAEMYWTGGVKSTEEAPDEPATDEGEAKPERQEPEPGIRYRVVTGTSEVKFPDEMCAHCNGAPTVSKLPINTAVFQGSGLGERQMVTYRIPLCANCTERAYARSEEQQTARLQAHLISVLVAMLLVVVALATRLVDFQESVGLDLAILVLLAAMGYIIPAAFLLIRASRFPQPEDSKYVGTTLRVPADTEGTETAFEWRNPIYARRFVAANQEQAVSGAMKVHEREYEGT